MKLAFTTGQVANICGFSINTTRKLVDAGTLPSFRIPNSTHRRVSRAVLIEFMTKHGIPNHPELQDGPAVK